MFEHLIVACSRVSPRPVGGISSRSSGSIQQVLEPIGRFFHRDFGRSKKSSNLLQRLVWDHPRGAERGIDVTRRSTTAYLGLARCRSAHFAAAVGHTCPHNAHFGGSTQIALLCALHMHSCVQHWGQVRQAAAYRSRVSTGGGQVQPGRFLASLCPSRHICACQLHTPNHRIARIATPTVVTTRAPPRTRVGGSALRANRAAVCLLV